jgi:hypothetical protein
MPESSNIEIARALSERGEQRGAEPSKRPSLDLLEVVEAVLLAVVAIATAWSGYQAAKGTACRPSCTGRPLP